jgi:hypothetical protein
MLPRGHAEGERPPVNVVVNVGDRLCLAVAARIRHRQIGEFALHIAVFAEMVKRELLAVDAPGLEPAAGSASQWTGS